MYNREEYAPTERAAHIAACPHLGLDDDSSTFIAMPSRRHRCYLWNQMDRIDLDHQSNFCLTSAHTICPWLSIGDSPGTGIHGYAAELRENVGDALSTLAGQAPVAAGGLWRQIIRLAARGGRLSRKWAIVFWLWLRAMAVRSAHAAGPVLTRLADEMGRLVRRGIATAARRIRAISKATWLSMSALITRRPAATPASAAADAPPSGQDAEAVSSEPVQALEAIEGSPHAQPEPVQVEDSPPTVPAPAAPLSAPAASGATATAPQPAFNLPPLWPGPGSWQCAACTTINAGPMRVCRGCGRPSPAVEQELMSSGDGLLAQGLAGLKEGDEELAHLYFVKACKATPDNRIAWQWRAKTAAELEEVILCLEKLVALDPADTQAQTNLTWALQRRQHQAAQPVPAAPQQKVRRRDGRLVRQLRSWLLQAAGACAFLTGLALLLPYGLRLTAFDDKPQVRDYLVQLPSLRLPPVPVETPFAPAFDAGPFLPAILGLLLLHAAFLVVDGGGRVARVWTALLGIAAAGMFFQLGTNLPNSLYAAGVAAFAVVLAIAGDAGPAARRVPDPSPLDWRR